MLFILRSGWILIVLVSLACHGCSGGTDAAGDQASQPAETLAAPPSDVATATLPEKQFAAESQAESVPTPAPSPSDPSRLIPRTVLFGNPEKASARISPDGQHLSYLAPVDGVLNVWVGPTYDLSAARPVTEDKIRGIRSHSWAYTSKHILYTQDQKGDENWHVYSTNVETGVTIDLTPLEGVNARIEGVSERLPGTILIGLNDRDSRYHDIYRVDVATGKRELVQENPGLAGFLADDDFNIRFAMNYTPDGGQVILQRDVAKDWAEFIKIGPADAMTTGPAGFDKTGNVLYLLDSRDRNTGALVAIDLVSGDQKLIAENELADVGGVLAHPTEKNIQAVSFTYTRRQWQVLDPEIAPDLEYLQTVEDGELVITSRTLDDTLWTAAYILDDGPVKFYLYDRLARKALYLFSSRTDLDDYRLAKMHPVVIPARDGLPLVSYLTLPRAADTDGDTDDAARPDRPLPMVLVVHGGPWSRDDWGYHPTHQWLANRGYAVLSVNYRGSTGFGKDFINAANGQWARQMHDDLLDAVDWAIREKIADKHKVAIMGGSYGGYATLVGLTFTPEVFACGVDIVGPSSLVTLLENVPDYWLPFMPVMKDRVGDHKTPEGRKELLARSPLEWVESIERPLLIGQGANDPRVKQLEADQIVAAMQEKQIPVTYVLFPDEGHGFARPENRLSFNAVTEAFLAQHLGGRFERVGDDFHGATISVPAGAEGVPGLADALSRQEAAAGRAN